MDRALKERIVGAVVLVAIVVLVVPVFLDGPAPEEREMISEPVLLPGQSREPGERRTVVLERDRDQPLPDTPEAAMHPVAAADRSIGAGAAPDGGASSDGAAAAKAATPAQDEPDKEDVADTGAARESKAQSAPEPKRESAPPPAEVKTAAAKKEAAPETASPEPAATESETGMWAVQLGSFSNKANADRLAAKLRAEGYAAFLSQLETASGELHRVRIGPQKDRASAEAVARRLSTEGLKGQVVPHP